MDDSSLVAREWGICRRRPSAFHNLRSASASAISVRTPYLVNRQSDVYEREGIDLDVSTLADWVDAAAATLMPLPLGCDDARRARLCRRASADDTTVPVIDETGFLKQGKASCGVARQYTGSAGKITNCQIGVFAAYVSRHGHAFIDRALYWPKGKTDDPARLKATYVPGDIGFSTKPQLAAEMIERALAAGVPFRWVAADSVYGVGDIERDLRKAGKGYVLGVNSNHWFASWGKPQWVVGTAEEIAKTQRRSDWRRLSAGAGTKGPRLHDWCYLELADLEGEELQPSQPSPLDTRPADPA